MTGQAKRQLPSAERAAAAAVVASAERAAAVAGAAPQSRQHRGRGVRHGRAIALFTTPFLSLYALFYILPVGYALYASFTKVQRASAYAKGEEVFGSLDQYRRVFQSADFWASLRRVLLLLVTQVPVTILLGLTFALLIDSPLVKGRRFFRLAFFAPYAVPGVVAAIMWGFFYAPTLSPVRSWAEALDLLSGPHVLWAVANIVVWTAAGFTMLVMYSAMQAIPQELFEAARIDGAGYLRIAWSIKIPSIMPTIIMAGVLSIIGTLQLFNEPTVLLKLSDAMTSDYTPNMLVFATSAVPNYPLAAAFSVVLAVSTCILSFAFLKSMQKRAFQA
ncbi:MAG: sugar ABC transporter permease [Bifidobacteriaceae bacterium]|nr:sugar ABC transporter permease [Bifidobacteriaceae bacterium]